MYEGSYQVIAGQWGYVTSCINEYIDGSSVVTIVLSEGYYDDFTFDFGWTVSGGITQANDGMWERGNPEGTTSQGDVFNPEDDVNSDCTDFAYVTGLAAGSQTGSNDVDDFNTILTSPIFDLTSNQPHYLSYHSWFMNGYSWGSPPNDSLTVNITNGNTTVVLETMTSNSPDLGQWNLRVYDLSQYISLTSNMQLIIETADWDALGGHWVEGGFDKFQISSVPPTAIDEIISENKRTLIKIVDVLGREVNPTENITLFYIYDDGSVENKLIIE
jgi:hypothetical protein